MKLSADARSLGVFDRTAWRWFKAGKVAGFQADPGAILVTEAIVEAVLVTANPKTVIDTRVSAAENQDHLGGQAKGRMDYCAAKGYQVQRERLGGQRHSSKAAEMAHRSDYRPNGGGTQRPPDPFWVHSSSHGW